MNAVAAGKQNTARARAVYPGSVRIIGGIWRNRKLAVPLIEGLRPTPDRVRETLFNWLTPYLPGSRCLDLFSGTGALCLEALSRGAAEVVMVERATKAAQALQENLNALQAQGAQVIHTEALAFLARSSRPFDIIFIDPPFVVAADQISRCANSIDDGGWLKTDGLVYIEAPSTFKELPLPSTWKLVKSKTAGQVSYYLVQK